ncbi:hypothetical protein MF672_038930 [Actinomadura sp. ATCC 31491]|uniref:ATPase n=1 Tax=Actinomadura luzonensis TaxID=2805427 RepID=A0ABT0G545_9ACTN|nr:hypothetical protein [Actinomadura luzonensis]MCK2219729.1 hypothetical protein [Actinomadura luzonensis]
MTQLDPLGPLVLRLERSITNLDAYIEQRAREIANPRITATEQDADERIATAEQERDHWRTRFTDLQREHERQRTALERQLRTARAAITRVHSTLFLNTTAHVSGVTPTDQPLTDYQRG